jgi:hypothetical protein
VNEVENWGPTRGDLANDPEFLDHVTQEWLNPSGRYYGEPRQVGRPRDLTGDVKVLYAGTTPDGPAAVVAQRTTEKDIDIYLGFLLPAGTNDVHLVAAFSPKLYAQSEIGFGSRGLDTNQISFKTTVAGDHLVVLPSHRSDSVSVSRSHTLDATGHVHRDWSDVPTHDGVAVVTASGQLRSWDTLIRVNHIGAVIDEAPASDVLIGYEGIAADAMPPEPSNALNWPLSDQGIGGSISGGGYRANLNDPWLEQYAKPDEPYGGHWWVSGSAQDRRMILVEQLWFYGDPGHTVVLRVLDKNAQLLLDEVTDPTDRPLVFMRLPDALGWLVVGAPDTTITGWREAGASNWSNIETGTAETDGGKPVHTDKSTFIQSTADHIQVRMQVNGKTQVASK